MLDNFYNQRNHKNFDRFLALQLLDYAYENKYPEDYSKEKQEELLVPLRKLIDESTDTTSKKNVNFVVVPGLRKLKKNNKGWMYLNPYSLTDWLPNTFMNYVDLVKNK